MANETEEIVTDTDRIFLPRRAHQWGKNPKGARFFKEPLTLL